jgi:hypothetical protein
MKLGRWFDTLSIALVPVALLIGIGFGIEFSTGQYPVDMVGKVIPVVVGSWIGIMIIWWLLDVVAGSLLEQLYDESMREPNEGSPGELVLLLLRDGEVVQELRSWDKPIDRGKRMFWQKKLPRILINRGNKKTEA